MARQNTIECVKECTRVTLFFSNGLHLYLENEHKQICVEIEEWDIKNKNPRYESLTLTRRQIEQLLLGMSKALIHLDYPDKTCDED